MLKRIICFLLAPFYLLVVYLLRPIWKKLQSNKPSIGSQEAYEGFIALHYAASDNVVPAEITAGTAPDGSSAVANKPLRVVAPPPRTQHFRLVRYPWGVGCRNGMCIRVPAV